MTSRGCLAATEAFFVSIIGPCTSFLFTSNAHTPGLADALSCPLTRLVQLGCRVKSGPNRSHRGRISPTPETHASARNRRRRALCAEITWGARDAVGLLLLSLKPPRRTIVAVILRRLVLVTSWCARLPVHSAGATVTYFALFAGILYACCVGSLLARLCNIARTDVSSGARSTDRRPWCRCPSHTRFAFVFPLHVLERVGIAKLAILDAVVIAYLYFGGLVSIKPANRTIYAIVVVCCILGVIVVVFPLCADLARVAIVLGEILAFVVVVLPSRANGTIVGVVM